MNEEELYEMQLPGRWAVTHGEPPSWGWIALWLAWGGAIASLLAWREGGYAIAGFFAGLGLFMGFCSEKVLMFGTFLVHDWAKRHCTDADLEFAALREQFEFLDANYPDAEELDETTIQFLDSPLQKRSLEQDLFTMLFSIPWMMGLTHGLGFGAILGLLAGFIPGTGVSLTAWTIFGAAGGTIVGTGVIATAVAMSFGLGYSFSLRQRLLILVSPLLAVPALLEAAVLWGHWYLRRRARRSM